MRAYAPASVGNWIAGFDVLGAALAPLDGSLWGDVVTARPGTGRLEATGPYASRLPPRSSENLVLQSAALYAEAIGRPLEVDLVLHKGLPLCSGLGSSAASVVAALVAMEGWYDGALGPQSLLALAGQAEALVSGSVHLDNVGPAMRGGLQLCIGSQECQTLPWPADWHLAVVHPDILVPTAQARAALPDRIPLKQAVGYWQNLATLVHALHVEDTRLIAACMRDGIIEAARQRFVPGFVAAQQGAMAAGAAGCSLSGSGPSMIAVVPEAVDGEAVLAALAAPFCEQDIAVTAKLCTLDRVGSRLLPGDA